LRIQPSNLMDNSFDYKFIPPELSIANFVESIGMFQNLSDQDKEVVILPDGRVDLFFWKTAAKPFQVILIGLETEPEQRIIPSQTLAFVISFKPLAVEYILQTPIADILNSARELSNNFWGINTDDLKDFTVFYKVVSDKVRTLLPQVIDERKLHLFDLIYASKGEMSVQVLSQKVLWSSRQINRYFNLQFGLPLKSYCGILRFRASLEHIARGKLFPELNFSDQTHFIKEIKRLSGVVPKELSKNKNDRFVLLSVLKQQ
jgi:AraC-like DNA-binding protein